MSNSFIIFLDISNIYIAMLSEFTDMIFKERCIFFHFKMQLNQEPAPSCLHTKDGVSHTKDRIASRRNHFYSSENKIICANKVYSE